MVRAIKTWLVANELQVQAFLYGACGAGVMLCFVLAMHLGYVLGRGDGALAAIVGG